MYSGLKTSNAHNSLLECAMQLKQAPFNFNFFTDSHIGTLRTQVSWSLATPTVCPPCAPLSTRPAARTLWTVSRSWASCEWHAGLINYTPHASSGGAWLGRVLWWKYGHAALFNFLDLLYTVWFHSQCVSVYGTLPSVKVIVIRSLAIPFFTLSCRVVSELILRGHLFRKGQMKVSVFKLYQVYACTLA